MRSQKKASKKSRGRKQGSSELNPKAFLPTGDVSESDYDFVIEGQIPRKANLFVRDYSARSFVGTSFYIGPRHAIYEQECLERNVLPRIRGVFYDNRFSQVDPMKVLRLVIGNSLEYSMRRKGPVYYSPVGGYPSDYDFNDLFLMQDRILLCSLMEALFSMKECVARNTAATPLHCSLDKIEYGHNTAFRKAVFVFTAGSLDDYLRVTVQGEKNDPNTFTFERSINWIKNRYCHADAISCEVESAQ